MRHPLITWVGSIIRIFRATVTGSLLLALMGLLQVFGVRVPRGSYAGVAMFFLLWAFYGAWLKEYHARLEGEVQQEARIRVEIREVLTQSRLFKKLNQVADLTDPNLDFDVFVNLWVVNEGQFPVTVRGYSLSLDTGGSIVWAERVRGDLDKWYIDDTGETVGMWGEPRTERIRRQLAPDLDGGNGKPLERGIHQDGWLHFLFRDVTLSRVQSGSITAVLQDSLLKKHAGVSPGPRQVPGNVWPKDID